jgi:hypothetical protein
MYSKDFYITGPIWNNSFSYNDRKNKQLYVPALKKITSFDEIRLHPYLSPTLSWDERELAARRVTFEEYDFCDVMQTCYWLENLYYLALDFPTQHLSPTLSCQEREQITKKTPLYLVDNHNHVMYFWYLARQQGIITDDALLYHIDEHADMRDPWEYLLKPDSLDLQKVFDYTNFTLNVGNYIIPTEKEGLIGNTVQIRWQDALDKYLSWEYKYLETNDRKIILNLDLDFFEPELDFINYDLKKQVILDIAKKADLITVCTSPYFIDQERALEVFRDLFD